MHTFGGHFANRFQKVSNSITFIDKTHTVSQFVGYPYKPMKMKIPRKSWEFPGPWNFPSFLWESFKVKWHLETVQV